MTEMGRFGALKGLVSAIAGIAALEMNGPCKTNQLCPSARPDQARGALVSLLGGARGRATTGNVLVIGRSMTCLSRGNAMGAALAPGADLQMDVICPVPC